MPEPPIAESGSTRQQRIAMLAKQDPQRAFMSLNHYLDLAWVREAFQRTRKDGASGVDGQTGAGYAEHLAAHLQARLERAKSGTYRAPPVRRVSISKGTGKATRPIGIPTREDKGLQRAVVLILAAIYEQDFYHGSYGYRPGRSAHQALDRLWKQTMQTGGGWVLEVDIRTFFDALDHGHLRVFLQKRVRDGVLWRLMGKWLKAGVLEDGCVWYPESGSPQGGVISPRLANVFLPYVLDEWFACEVQPHLQSRAFVIRYADDGVIGFTREDEARRVLEVLPTRFGPYSLTIHPDKTRLVSFQRPPHASPPTGSPQCERPWTFDRLGFTHFWSRSRTGNWVVKRKTSASRFTRAVRKISHWCRRHRHDPIEEQYRTLCQKLRGHNAYYGITGNSPSLWRFREEVKRLWRKWLYRRKRGRGPGWSWFNRLLERYPLPKSVTYHSVYHREAKE